MIRSQKPRKVKGALLIMVLTVMFVLIFLLAGTIAVVYSSNSRVMNKYEETQAYYTARSVLDTYIDTFLKDNDNKAGENGTTHVDYYYITTSGGTKTQTTAQAKQGRAMELDLYKLAVDLDTQTDGTQTVPPSNDTHLPVWFKEKWAGRIYGEGVLTEAGMIAEGVPATTRSNYEEALDWLINKASITPAKQHEYEYWKQTLVDAANPVSTSFDHNVPGNVYGDATSHNIDLSVHTDDQLYGSFQNFYDQYCVGSDDTMYYIVPHGTFNDYGGITDKYGKLVDTEDQRQSYNSFTSDYPDAVIKVQMLERSYHIAAEDESDFKFMFDGGVRAKDYVKVNVTSTVYFDGVPTTTSIVYKTKYTPTPAADNALTAFGGINSSTSGFNVDGGMSSLSNANRLMDWVDTADLNSPFFDYASVHPAYVSGSNDLNDTFNFNAAQCSGSVFMEGNMLMDTAGDTMLGEGGSFTVKGNLWGRNAIKIRCNPSLTVNNAFIYVAGEFGRRSYDNSFNNQINVAVDNGGNPDAQTIDVIAEKISVPQNGVAINGNVFTECFDHSLGNPNGVPLKKQLYAKVVVLKNDVNFGKIEADVGGTYKITMGRYGVGCDDVTIGGYIVFRDQATDQTFTDATHQTLKDNISARYGLNLDANDWFVDLNDPTMIDLPTQFLKDPSATANYRVWTQDTINTNYNNPSLYDSQLTSDHKKQFTMPGNHKYDVDTAYSKYGQYFAKESFYTEDDMPIDTHHLGDLKDYEEPWDDPGVETACQRAQVITGGETCKLNSPVTIAPGSTIGSGNYVLNPGNNGDVTVNTESGDVAIQLKEGGGDFEGNLIITGTGKCTILVPEDGSTYGIGSTARDMNIIYKETWDGNDNGISGHVLRTGTDNGDGLTAVPEVDIIVGGNSTIFPKRNSVVTGYIYGPGCHIQVNTDTHGTNLNYYENGGFVHSGSYWLVGSAICREYDNSNVGVAFISRNTDTSVPGDRLFGWSDVYYTRGE